MKMSEFDKVYLLVYIFKGVIGNLGFFVLYNVSKVVESSVRNEKILLLGYFEFIVLLNEILVVIVVFLFDVVKEEKFVVDSVVVL